MDSNEMWTRKLDSGTLLYYECIKRDFLRIRYWLVLNAKKPLEEDQIRTTMSHLYKKVPTLRLCIRRRENNELWFRNMEEEKLDLKMFQESKFDEEFKSSMTETFDQENGPLWHVKVFPDSKKCRMPEVETEFPHQYNLLFVFHHCITDGTSNVWICDHFLNLLNDVLSGKEIDGTQYGVHGSPEDYDHIIESLSKELTPDSKRFKECRERMKKCEEGPNYMVEAFGAPNSEPIIDSVYHDFSSAETKAILVKCKENGVSLNSFMSNAINVSIYEMLQKSQFSGKELYEIPNVQLVNIRRYLKDPNAKVFGEFAPFIYNYSTTKPDGRKTFWQDAKVFQNEMLRRLNNYGSFEDDICHDDSEVNPWLSDDPNDVHKIYYVTSNMGNLAKNFAGTGDLVQATYFNRATSFIKLHSLIEMHTFRGCLLFAIDYWPPMMSKDKVQLWLETIINVVEQLIKK